MTELIRKKLNDSPIARWTAMFIVSFTMMCGYFITDVMASLEVMCTTPVADGGLGWSSSEYGFFSGAYGYINVFLLMLFFGGIILDKCGIRFTGVMSSSLMLGGALLKWYALATDFGDATFMGYHLQVVLASLGFAVFGMGAMHSVSYPVLFGALCLCLGLVAYLVYCVMDKKLDQSVEAVSEEKEEGFQLKDLKLIFTNKGFWLITLLCLMFYAGVFPFLKFATKLMIAKYHVEPEMAGLIPAMLPFGTILLTPVFGTLYDRIGKGATLMLIGSVMLTIVHLLFALPILPTWWFAIVIMVVLGIAFSLVPSALWPSVPKIIPMKQLGSAYATIFYIQNIGLSMVPVLIGWVIETYSTHVDGAGVVTYDYTIPMLIFATFGIVAIFISLWLKREDARSHYGLEDPNMKK